MRSKRKCLVIFSVIISLILGGCSGKKNIQNEKDQKEIKIPVILTIDPSTGKKNEEEVINAFNKRYKEKYYIDVKWVLQTEEEYRTNLKKLNVTDKLPAIIPGIRLLPSYYQLMIHDQRIEELSSYIKEDEEWRNIIEPSVLQACTEPNGSIFLAPLSTAFFSCSGVFWNERLFRQAGIEEFPKTWEEFWTCCEKLKNNGITPLALHTEGTAWAPMLFATAELADSQRGIEFLNTLYPESYQNENGFQLAHTLKRLFQYTTEDAMYNDFDVSYQNFVSGKVAMIPNGYWMIDQIPSSVVEDMRFAPFPGNKLISSPETFGWAIVSTYSEEVKKGAALFLKYRAMFNLQQKEKVLQMKPENNSRLLNDYMKAYTEKSQIIPNYQVKWNSVLQEETFGEYIPKLIKNQITEEEFVLKADRSIEQYEKER